MTDRLTDDQLDDIRTYVNKCFAGKKYTAFHDPYQLSILLDQAKLANQQAEEITRLEGKVAAFLKSVYTLSESINYRVRALGEDSLNVQNLEKEAGELYALSTGQRSLTTTAQAHDERVRREAIEECIKAVQSAYELAETSDCPTPFGDVASGVFLATDALEALQTLKEGK